MDKLHRIRNPLPDDPCPCGTGFTYQKCNMPETFEASDPPHTPDALEYAWLVGKYYPNDITRGVATRMLELEKLLQMETLVDDKWRKNVR